MADQQSDSDESLCDDSVTHNEVGRRLNALSARQKRSLSTPLEHSLVQTFLQLEELDVNLFRSHHLLAGNSETNRVYGGQVIGQALHAATRTVDPKLMAHSLHCYFMLPGDNTIPILYQVDRVRDNRSFCTRVVKAIQRGANIFTATISFHKEEIDSIVHQSPMPDVPPPEECDDAVVFLERYFNNPERLSPEGVKAIEAYRKVLDFPTTVDLKMVNPRANIQTAVGGPLKAQVWVKTKTPLDSDMYLHQCIAAWFSDITPVGTPIGAHAGAGFRLGMAASLDHSLWIHRRQFKCDEWMLYETISTAAAGSRALIHGKMWSQDGTLIMSSAQEILVRKDRDQ